MPRRFPLLSLLQHPLPYYFLILELLHSYAGAKDAARALASRWSTLTLGSRRARARPRSSSRRSPCGTGCPSRTTRRRTPRCLRAKRQMSARSFARKLACARRKETHLVKHTTTSTASEAVSPHRASARRSSGRRCYWPAAAEDPAQSSAASSSSWPRASRPPRTTAA